MRVDVQYGLIASVLAVARASGSALRSMYMHYHAARSLRKKAKQGGEIRL